VHAYEVYTPETNAYETRREMHVHELGTWGPITPVCGDHSALKPE
jgi:hypothetical protein